MIIFISIVLAVYSSVNYYIARRGWQALSGHSLLRLVFLVVFLFLIASYPVGRILERMIQNHVTGFLIMAGAFYLAAMVYGFFLVLLIDILRLIHKIFHIFPGVVTRNPGPAAFMAFWVVLVLIAGTICGGWINASRPRIRNVEVAIAKPGGRFKELTIVHASDIHFGTVLGRSRLERIVDLINNCRPDLVLLGGDTLDEDVTAAKAAELSSILGKLRPKLGIYAVLGNHESYAGVEKCLSALKQTGVTVLRDEAVLVGDSFYLIGRKDREARRGKESRKSLESLLVDCDRSKPLILLDHQPFHLEEAEKTGIDLQLSGHTHAGQLFPFDLINKRMYKINWGTLQKGRTTIDVSCGAGTWGPPVNTAGRSEVVRMRMTFTPAE